MVLKKINYLNLKKIKKNILLDTKDIIYIYIFRKNGY